MSNVSIAQLTSMKSASGKVVRDGNVVKGVLTIVTAHGNIEMTVAEWDAMYRAQVNCWPAVRPLKEKVLVEQRKLAATIKAEEKEKRDAEKKAAKKKAAADREAARKLSAKAKKGKTKKSKAKAKKSAPAPKAEESTTQATEQSQAAAAA